MSEERRKRQQERQGVEEIKSNKWLLYAGLVILFAGAFFGGRYYKDHKYDSFARCLASKDAKMYGLYWCPHCAEQKEMFGAAFHNVNYVECAIKDKPGELAPACKVAGVKLFPVGNSAGSSRKKACFPLKP